MARQTQRVLPIGFPGAKAEETARSRLGIQSGVFGVYGATREWRVYCPGAQDNPLAVLRSLSSSLGGVREGDNYPWTEMSSMVLLYFTLVDHWVGTNIWTVQGTYGPPLLFTQAPNVWNFRTQDAGDTEHVWSELPWRRAEGGPLQSRTVGTPRFIPQPAATSAPFLATKKDGVQYLSLATGETNFFDPKLQRFAEGMSRDSDTSVLQLWKTIPAWRHEAVIAAIRFKNHVNRDEFRSLTLAGDLKWADAPTEQFGGIVRLVGCTIEGIQGASPTEGVLQNVTPGVPGGSYQVSLTFKINPAGHQYDRTVTYKDEDSGVESPVEYAPEAGLSPGRLAEKFLRYYDTNLSAIVGAFG